MENPEWFGKKTPFNRRFALYLPTRGKEGKAVSGFEDLAKATAEILCDLFGGVTSYPATGRFGRSNGATQQESVVVQESFCAQSVWDANSEHVHQLVAILSQLLDQESIACSLDGTMVFVPPVDLELATHGSVDKDTLSGLVKSGLSGGGGASPMT